MSTIYEIYTLQAENEALRDALDKSREANARLFERSVAKAVYDATRAQLAAANEDAARLAERLEFQRAWLTWCPDDDKALAAHAARVGGKNE